MRVRSDRTACCPAGSHRAPSEACRPASSHGVTVPLRERVSRSSGLIRARAVDRDVGGITASPGLRRRLVARFGHRDGGQLSRSDRTGPGRAVRPAPPPPIGLPLRAARSDRPARRAPPQPAPGRIAPLSLISLKKHPGTGIRTFGDVGGASTSSGSRARRAPGPFRLTGAVANVAGRSRSVAYVADTRYVAPVRPVPIGVTSASRTSHRNRTEPCRRYI